jgi:uncharacterized membrane protein
MPTRFAIALVLAILMLAIASWESSITSYPTAFNQLWENIRHIDYRTALHHFWANIKGIDAIVTAAATIFIAIFSGTLWWVNRRQGSDARVSIR